MIMFCSKCGLPLSPEDRFCKRCGAAIVPAAPVAEPIITPAPVEPAEPVVAPAPVEPAEPVVAPAPVEPIAEPVPAAATEVLCESDIAAAPVEPMEPPVAPPPVVPAPTPSPVATMTSAPKKKGKGLLIGLVAAIVAVLVAVGAFFLVSGILSNDEPEDPGSQISSTPDSQPTSDPTVDPPTVQPPLENIKLEVNGAELVYELTDADVQDFYDLLEQCKEAALGGQDGDTVMALSDQIDDLATYLDSQCSIAMILYYSDLNDEDASQLYLDSVDISTEIYDAYMEMAKALYDADFPAKERFFEEWTDQELAMLMAYTPEVMELEQRNSEIEVAYQDLQDDNDMYTKMVPLYIEMVQNNNRIAQIYGYDNYYEYAYELVYDRDYDIEEVRIMREYVSQYLPDAAEGALNRVVDSINNLSYAQYNKMTAFLWNSYEDDYTDEIEDYLETLPRTAQDAMLDMFNGNIVMKDTVDSAREGAFTTTIGEDRQICFFGPEYSNALTVLHEVGHYYGGTYTYLNDIPLDLAEVQSQGNEWLFMSFMKDEMLSKLYNTVVDYKLYSDMNTILISVIVDEFEERVYTHPDVASLTSDDLDAIMEDVCESYGGIEFLDEAVTEVQSYWRLVVVEQPVYYISYAVSAIAAIDIYTEAEEDYAEAVEIYCSLIENMDADDGFLGNLEKVGLDGPFEEDVYKKLYEMAN